MLKKLPILKTDQEAEDFIDNADLSEYDLSRFVPVKFEFVTKDKNLNMRLPEALLNGVKEKAKAAGMPYQRYIRSLLEDAVNKK